MRLVPLFLVGLGGFAGAIARYLVGQAAARRLGTDWPHGTFLINLSGCFLIGLVNTLIAEKLTVNEAWRLFFPIGFVGAYTTFSTYEYETLRLIEQQAVGRALSYVLLSTLVGFFAVALGVWLARRV